MKRQGDRISRRQALGLGAGALGMAGIGPDWRAWAQAATSVLARPIPHGGERLPVIGIGTAIVYDFPVDDEARMKERAEVLKVLVGGGGTLIDTAPSYGNAESVLGALFKSTGLRDRIFLATKVRVLEPAEQMKSMRASLGRLAVDKVDLMQLHNPRVPEQDLAAIREFQKEGLCKYIGFSSSFERDYAAVEAVLRREKPDFFQINYSLGARKAEERLLPLAQDVGAAVLTNLPFGRGKVFAKVKGQPLPEWASKELGVTSWAQFALKFLIGHPAVNAVIPGTDRVQHMSDNLKAGLGSMPDAALRKRMADHFDSL